MPIYEYNCKKCGSDFELLVMGGSEKIACEHCGSTSVKKKFSTFAVQSGTVGKHEMPSCAPGCSEGFSRGTCGSGMCCGGGR